MSSAGQVLGKELALRVLGQRPWSQLEVTMEPQAVRPRQVGLERTLGIPPPDLALLGPRLSHSCLDPHKDWCFSAATL